MLTKMTYQPQPNTLPTHLTLSNHIAARSYQLASFQKALLSARSTANLRAWQLLPRHARRRAASHNLLRLPKRLRSKGAAELKASNTLALKKSQIRRRFGDDRPLSRARKRTAQLLLRAAAAAKGGSKANPLTAPRSNFKSNTVNVLARASKLAARQPSHWLETHLWHAKRFNMSSHPRSHLHHGRDMSPVQRAEAETHAPFAVAYRPHMKGHRAAVRASTQQCTLRDVSWLAYIRLHLSFISKDAAGTSVAQTTFDKEPMSAQERLNDLTARLLRSAGARDGWQQEWRSGTRMSYTTLLGDPECIDSTSTNPSNKGKAREHAETSSSWRCHALFPLNIIWLNNETTSKSTPVVAQDPKKKGKSSRERKRLREQARKNRSDTIPAEAGGSNSTRKSTGEPGDEPGNDDGGGNAMSYQLQADEDDMDAMMNAGLPAQTKRKERRRYSRKKKPQKGETASRPISTSTAGPSSSSTTQNQQVEGSSSTAASSARVFHSKVVIQVHPACISTLVKKLRQSAARLSCPNRSLTVEIQELSAAPSAAVAVGRGRAATSTNDKAIRDDGATEKIKKGNVAGLDAPGRRQGPSAADRDTVSTDSARNVSEGFNAFELIGPDAGRVLAGVLKPVRSTSMERVQALQNLADQAQQRQMPSGLVLALDVHDPRLSFPPKLAKRAENASDGSTAEKGCENAGPSAHTLSPELACGSLFLTGGSLPKFSKGTVDSRRAKSLIPGKPLKPKADDDVVPVVIIQRSLSYSRVLRPNLSFPSSTAPNSAHGTAQDSRMRGFTLLVPRGWGSAFFHSLSYPSPTPVKVIGLEQARQQILEAGLASSSKGDEPTYGSLSFPHDWPHSGEVRTRGSGSGNGETLFRRWASVLARAEETVWKRTPPAKRENWDAKGVKWPFGPEDALLRSDGQGRAEEASMWGVFLQNAANMARATKGWTGLHKILAVLVATDPTEPQDAIKDERPWLCCLQSLEHSLAAFFRNEPKSSLSIGNWSTLSGAFVPVRVQACRKGIFGQWAEIHMTIAAEEMEPWKRVLKIMQSDRKQGERLADELGPWTPGSPQVGEASLSSHARARPPFATHIGTVTSGDYALTQGRGFAIGTIPLIAWLELCARENCDDEFGKRRQGKTRNAISRRGLVFVRERTSQMYRLASVEALVP
ncbi:hypothetical protein OC846_000416 [Tilletia horrida]|uniref:Uncharacterized protein n=1 Tax=Tilletia horrida TaxID=155126 RepID=A0AAN6GWY1_9BASI|nr:hypothetical protein OC846_000416 [Tilletia horrida]